ncbi:unnamed protein product [Ranitomeya imitator]|uniref:Fibrinogen C-terminal domain-containing protein n=1 Tax=Ranitomeya imitator TaxID=111125 RepID=A0ABN9LRL3_9NEOB|nr:unnamed protein product [Ranitomeya imitator]
MPIDRTAPQEVEPHIHYCNERYHVTAQYRKKLQAPGKPGTRRDRASSRTVPELCLNCKLLKDCVLPFAAKIPTKTAAIAAPRGAQEKKKGVPTWEETTKVAPKVTTAPSDYCYEMTTCPAAKELCPQKMEEQRVCATKGPGAEMTSSGYLSDDQVTRDHLGRPEVNLSLPLLGDPDIMDPQVVEPEPSTPGRRVNNSEGMEIGAVQEDRTGRTTVRAAAYSSVLISGADRHRWNHIRRRPSGLCLPCGLVLWTVDAEAFSKKASATSSCYLFLCLTAVPDCKSLLEKGFTLSDWYIIYLDGNQPLRVLCDMHTDGGGWIVFQRRYDGSVDFLRDWESYKTGFGSHLSEFWLGNENIHKITSSGTWELRVDLQDFDSSNSFAKYESFKVMGESEKYKLVVEGFVSGDAGDSLSYQNGMKFSTLDQDNDADSRKCVDLYKGAWWYNQCHQSNLNGLYLLGKHESFADGINWYSGKGYNYSYKRSEMKIRPAK